MRHFVGQGPVVFESGAGALAADEHRDGRAIDRLGTSEDYVVAARGLQINVDARHRKFAEIPDDRVGAMLDVAGDLLIGEGKLPVRNSDDKLGLPSMDGELMRRSADGDARGAEKNRNSEVRFLPAGKDQKTLQHGGVAHLFPDRIHLLLLFADEPKMCVTYSRVVKQREDGAPAGLERTP